MSHPLIHAENVVAFNYSILDISDEKVTKLRQAADYIRNHRRNIGNGIIEIGRALLAAKARLPHGQFGPWLEAEFDWTDRTARNYMLAAEKFESKPETISDLAPATIYALASPTTPESVREEVAARRDRGEQLPDSAVRHMISAAKSVEARSNRRRAAKKARQACRSPDAVRHDETARSDAADTLAKSEAALRQIVEILLKSDVERLLQLFDEAGPVGLWSLPQKLREARP